MYGATRSGVAMPISRRLAPLEEVQGLCHRDRDKERAARVTGVGGGTCSLHMLEEVAESSTHKQEELNLFTSLGTTILTNRSLQCYGLERECSRSSSPKHKSKRQLQSPHRNPLLECEAFLAVTDESLPSMQEHMDHLWKEGMPLCLEVKGQIKSSFGEGEASSSSFLLEQWLLQLVPKRSHTHHSTPGSLEQAVKSFLYFSQIRSWLVSCGGSLPFDLVCRVCTPAEENWEHFTISSPERHSFPTAAISQHWTLQVSVSHLPRRPLPFLARKGVPPGEGGLGGRGGGGGGGGGRTFRLDSPLPKQRLDSQQCCHSTVGRSKSQERCHTGGPAGVSPQALDQLEKAISLLQVSTQNITSPLSPISPPSLCHSVAISNDPSTTRNSTRGIPSSPSSLLSQSGDKSGHTPSNYHHHPHHHHYHNHHHHHHSACNNYRDFPFSSPTPSPLSPKLLAGLGFRDNNNNNTRKEGCCHDDVTADSMRAREQLQFCCHSDSGVVGRVDMGERCGGRGEEEREEEGGEREEEKSVAIPVLTTKARRQLVLNRCCHDNDGQTATATCARACHSKHEHFCFHQSIPPLTNASTPTPTPTPPTPPPHPLSQHPLPLPLPLPLSLPWDHHHTPPPPSASASISTSSREHTPQPSSPSTPSSLQPLPSPQDSITASSIAAAAAATTRGRDGGRTEMELKGDGHIFESEGVHYVESRRRRDCFRNEWPTSYVSSSSNCSSGVRPPAASSPVPFVMRHRSAGDRDRDSSRRSSCAVSMKTNVMYQSPQRSMSVPAAMSSLSLLGTFEESVLNGRIEPCGYVEGFTAELGASGSFCPRHVMLPVTAAFFELCDVGGRPSPYLGHVDLSSIGRKGYHIPRRGTVQVTLFNPNKTVVKIFIVTHDLRDMPPKSQTFIRQRTVSQPCHGTSAGASSSSSVSGAASASQAASTTGRLPSLDYLIHLRYRSSKSGHVYLHTDIRLIFARRAPDLDPDLSKVSLRTDTKVPCDPKYSPVKSLPPPPSSNNNNNIITNDNNQLISMKQQQQQKQQQQSTSPPHSPWSLNRD